MGFVPEKDFGPSPLRSVQNSKYVQNSIERLGWLAGSIGAVGPNILGCVCYYIRLAALLY